MLDLGNIKITKPKKLLTTINSKTTKGRKKGFETYIMYLAPHRQNSKGINLCSHASKGCADACLFYSGHAFFNNVQKGKINKTEYFLNDRKGFLEQLDNEITKIKKNHLSSELQPVFRLNGSSDIAFEKFKIRDDKNIFELHSDVIFYDYTKNYFRFKKELPSNYHLTFSMSEENKDISMDMLKNGVNVAMVFHSPSNNLPDVYNGFKVINGDETDLRFLDSKNGETVIVGLKFKFKTIKGSNNKDLIENNDFIINLDY